MSKAMSEANHKKGILTCSLLKSPPSETATREAMRHDEMSEKFDFSAAATAHYACAHCPHLEPHVHTNLLSNIFIADFLLFARLRGCTLSAKL